MPEHRAGVFAVRLGACVSLLVLACSGNISEPVAGSGATDADGGTSSVGGSAGAGGSGAKASGGTGNMGGASGSATGGTSGSGTAGKEPTDEECAAQSGAALKVGRSRLSRLTRSQLAHTLRDLLKVTGNETDSLTPDQSVGPFASNGLAEVTDLIVQQHQELAAKVALEAQDRMAEIAPCDLATGATCVGEFIEKIGLKAYRRPLTSDEVTAYESVYAVGGSPENGFRVVLEAMLESPYFLYHADVGVRGEPSETPVALTQYELASRLSYFIWDSMPDQALFDLAAAGTLDDDATLSAEVERLLAHERAREAIPLFHLQWLNISPAELGSLASSKPDVAQAMLDEASDFANHVVLDGDGLLRTLFTAPYSYPRGGLFEIYGINRPAGFEDGTQVMLNAAQRSGILTLPGFLTKHYRGDQAGSVVHRGITVRENLLCTPIDPPPPEVMATVLPPAQGSTARDRFAAHETGVCAGCHTQIDPIGLAFENYDGLGKYRTTDGGVTIDASGEIFDSGAELAGAFDGIVELGAKLADSRTVGDCVANQWFRFALGRIESADDACSLKAVRDGFAKSDYNVRTLITKMVLSDAFRHVRAVGDGDGQ